jgi:ubiquinone/menaquinone biosynthesis C-methylase UbiE
MPPRRIRLIGRTLSWIAAHAPWAWALIRGPVTRFWNRMAARWDSNMSPDRTKGLEAALAEVGQPQRILEIGTGTGTGAAILKAAFPNAEITAVDLSPEMVRIATTKVQGVTFEPADASRLPFRDGSFDLVTQNNVPVYFGEITRVLAPGGRIVVTSTHGPATPYYTPHKVLAKHFGKLGFKDLRSEQSPPGDWFMATK